MEAVSEEHRSVGGFRIIASHSIQPKHRQEEDSVVQL